jgi:AraC family transcriptional regulator
MTYHQTLEAQAQPTESWTGAVAGKPEVPITILENILEDVRRALSHDPGAARAGIDRLSAILHGDEAPLAGPAYKRGGFAPWQKRRIESYLLDHLEQSVSIRSLARTVSLSASHFCRAFKQSFGQTPHSYLTGLRVERAKKMMLATAEPLSQIALSCGLADQAHLCKLFRRLVGQTPSVWRRMNDARA